MSAGFDTKCPDCGKPARVSTGQKSCGGHLYWFESIHCQGCGLAQEADGEGVPPENIRRRILEAEGEWNLLIPAPRSTQRIAGILRQLLDCSLAQALAKAKSAAPVATGTKAEMSWMADSLSAAGEEPAVAPLASTPGTSLQDRVSRFLDTPVPGGRTKSWDDWQKSAEALGPQAADILMHALAVGPAHTHYAALLGLRFCGFEAWYRDDQSPVCYEVRKKGDRDWGRIIPVNDPRADDGRGFTAEGRKPEA